MNIYLTLLALSTISIFLIWIDMIIIVNEEYKKVDVEKTSIILYLLKFLKLLIMNLMVIPGLCTLFIYIFYHENYKENVYISLDNDVRLERKEV